MSEIPLTMTNKSMNLTFFVIFLCNQSQLRAYQTTQSASSITVKFFKTLSTDILSVIQMLEEAKGMYDQKLDEFSKKYEVFFFVSSIISITPFSSLITIIL